MSNTNLKSKATKKVSGNISSSKNNDIKAKDAYRSANVSSSLTNSKMNKTGGGLSSTLKITKKVSNRINQNRFLADSRENTERR